MRSACRPNRPRSRTRRHRQCGPGRISKPCASNSAEWASVTIGAARSQRVTLHTIGGSNCSSFECWKRAWPTEKAPRSIGATNAGRCWPTSKWMETSVGAATDRCVKENSISGSCGLRTTRTNFLPDSTSSTVGRKSRHHAAQLDRSQHRR